MMVQLQATSEAVERLLRRGVAQVEKEADLRRLLIEGNKGQPLLVKLGVDPSHYDLTMQLIVGLDGYMKMGKSLNNYIAMTAPAKDMYGKLMSLPDHVMMSYFETLTDVPQGELDEFARDMAEGTLNPRDVKMRMAREIVAGFHNLEATQEAEGNFLRQFSERKLPTDMPEYRLIAPVDILTLLVDAGLAKSKSEARRLIQQGGVSFFPQGENSEARRITAVDFIVPAQNGAILRVGKLQYIRIVL
jgi:tyrosyl-tRNA synthetase